MKRFSLLLLLSAALAPVASLHAQDLLNQFPVQPPGKSAKPDKAKRAPQSKVAAKGEFPTIKSTDAAVKSARPASDLAGAKKLVGKEVKIIGTVAKVYAPQSNTLVLLNFAKNYKTAVIGAVKAEHFAKFPDLNKLAGKKVLLSGKMISFKGAPEVELTKVGAIRVVK